MAPMSNTLVIEAQEAVLYFQLHGEQHGRGEILASRRRELLIEVTSKNKNADSLRRLRE